MIKTMLLDLRPIRQNRPFARLLAGSFGSSIGSALSQFGVLFQVWQLTQAPAATGQLALLRAAPMLLLTPYGGSLADRYQLRTIVGSATLADLGLTGLLALQAIAGWHQGWLLYGIIVISGSVRALRNPAAEAILPLLVTKDRLAAARAMTGLASQLSMLIGPALAGLIITVWGLGICYAADVAVCLFGLIAVLGLPRHRLQAPRQPHLPAIVAGLRLAITTRPLRAALGLDLALTALAFPIALLPALNQHLGGNAQSLGLLMSCLGVGGLIAGLCSGLLTRADRPGVAMTATAIVWCAAVIVLGCASSLLIAAAAMLAWGAADTWFGIPRGTLVQLLSPPEHRGRIAAANQLVGQGGPAIGDARAGVVAAAVGIGAALVIGGFSAAIASVLISWRLPEARRYRISHNGDRSGRSARPRPACG